MQHFLHYYYKIVLRSPHKMILLLSVFCTLFLGCKKEPHPNVPPVSVRRTVLVYLGTDNEFRTEAVQKIDTLRKYWNKTNDGNLLVYADTGGNPVLVHIYYSNQRGNVADTIEIYPSENSANPATFHRVLQKAKTYRPAASYGLVVLSHATGWLPAEMSSPDIKLKAVIQDKGTSETNNYMELKDFADAIPCHLDFIIFDACLMGSVEVCYELKNKVDYIVASPAEVLAPGFVYATMMPLLFAPAPDLTSVAREFYEYYHNQSGYYQSATVSVIKTAALAELATVIRDITPPAFLPDGWENIQTFGYGAQKIYFDLEDYCKRLSPENHDRIQKALDQCVLYKRCTPSFFSSGTKTMQAIQNFCGLTVYIPQAAYPQANEAYRKLEWAMLK